MACKSAFVALIRRRWGGGERWRSSPQLCVPHLSPRRLMISDGPMGERYSTRDNRVSHALQAPKCACVPCLRCRHFAVSALQTTAWPGAFCRLCHGRLVASLQRSAQPPALAVATSELRWLLVCGVCRSSLPACCLFFAAHDWHRLCRSCCLLYTAECGVGDGRRAARRTKCGGSWAGSAGWCAPAAWRVQRRGAR